MFIKSLNISWKSWNIRNIEFHNWLNLIIDETPFTNDKSTWNNVWKTTVLKLVDFCLWAKQNIIYTDEESKEEYTLVKNFLFDEEVIITLVLKENLDEVTSDEIKIERNFLKNSKSILQINGEKIKKMEFESILLKKLFYNLTWDKPSLRQVISHNIRYSDFGVNRTLKTINPFTTDSEYESLYLYLFNCNFNKWATRQEILSRKNQEINFKKKLEKDKTKNTYKTLLDIIFSEIKDLENKKATIKVNPNFEQDILDFNNIKYKLSKLGNEVGKLEIRKDIIIESKEELESQKANIDYEQLKNIYNQAKKYITNLHKTFEDLCNYHNSMIEEKLKFIVWELPDLDIKLRDKKQEIEKLMLEEEKLSKKIEMSDSFDRLEDIILELNKKYQKKWEYESKITQIESIESIINNYDKDLDLIDVDLFSEKYQEVIEWQLKKFNKYFSEVSDKLYWEKYAIKYEIDKDKNWNNLYKFISFNTNMSSGKKQWEISSFDIAYMLFAKSEGIPYLSFLLNDKKELMHDNQLSNISKLVSANNIQFIASILKDKLPNDLNKEEYFIIKLSQKEKLFNIEK